MAYGDNAHLLEVVGRQDEQYLGIDAILAECRLVALKAQALSQSATSIAAPWPSRAAGKACAPLALICPAATGHGTQPVAGRDP